MRPRKLDAHGIATALQQLRAGESVRSICATWKITQSTLYHWRETYGELSANEIARINSLTAEISKLRKREKDIAFDCMILQNTIKWLRPNSCERRALVDILIARFNLSLARACRLAGISRTFYEYEPRRKHATTVNCIKPGQSIDRK
ncbi:transposase [Burkholderia cenocepacia]|uniref:transposase n=1 Tax=Burkholderia cenocepacia TaxID=95486 RepID=UPI000F59FA47|nr:hypothetical protein DF143_36450 [Burkholderia cenocepacia]RQV32483.1 hypothetical protein DF033_36130 [Burkholderia cenocepacia]